MHVRLSKAWVIAQKDLKVFSRKRSIVLSLTILPIVISLGLSYLVRIIANHSEVSDDFLTSFANGFSFWFVILASFIPTTIASYSLVGEKIEKSLEPLLATPVTDEEIFFGKGIAGFLPTLAVIYACFLLYAGLVDAFTFGRLGYLYYPNWNMGLIMLLVMPVVLLASIELGIIVSSKVSDVRTAQTLGALASLPFGAVYVASEIQYITLNNATFLVIAGIVLVLDIFLYFITGKVFRRESILTQWK